MDPDAREVRIWWGLSLAYPQEFIRIVDYRGDVVGDIGRFWDIRSFGDPEDYKASWVNEFRREMRSFGCGEIKKGVGVEACLVKTKPEPDWALALDRLDSLGVWTLPDENELGSERELILDGWGMVVEIRIGERYRIYSYSNPDAYALPETLAAVGIAGVVRDLSGQYWK